MIMYRQDLDALKGIAIIAVVLFHMGLLKSGYLGVDAFFVINGFLVIPSVIKKIGSYEFSFLSFMEKRIVRLLPLIVLASVACLILGYFLMLPDHYEGIAESVIAGNLMSENILSAITTKNYWDVSNEYKPLMHLWYVGILFEFYILLPLLMLFTNGIAKKLKRDGKKWMVVALSSLCAISFLLYVLPYGTTGNKFYYLPYRFFELATGGLVAMYIGKVEGGQKLSTLQNIVAIGLALVICCSLYNVITGNTVSERVVIGKELSKSNGLPISSTFALLLTVVLTAIVVACKNGGSLLLRSRALAWFGKMSYSIFIWHQVLLAFYRYSISYEMSAFAIFVFLAATLVVSVLSYYHVEKKIATSHMSFASWCVVAALVMIPSGYLYQHAGVVRDVPELDIKKGTEYRGMFGKYCDRVYNYNKDFENNGKINVLVVNISFGRDFANVLLESPYKDSINLSYVYLWRYPEAMQRATKADYIFSFTSKKDIPNDVWENIKPTAKVYGIGTKNYGFCNGYSYVHRSSPKFHRMSNPIVPGYIELNNEWKDEWKENYIDFITPALNDDGSVKIFTPDNKYIAQDCKHFTQAGAKWYASIIDWKKIFSNE